MANRYGITNNNKKNAKREQKIIQRVNVLENKLLSMISDYMEGKPVETVTDTLGNEYVWVFIGENTYFDGGRRKDPHISNHKTDDIFQMLYSRMSKHGYVLCKHAGHGERAKWDTEGWVLVFQNAVPIDKKEESKLDVIHTD